MNDTTSQKLKELLTASRMGALLSCPRKHYWRYEVGLRSTQNDATALRFGRAWHAAMEARTKGMPFEDALKAGIDTSTGNTLDELQVATLGALLGAYYRHYCAKDYMIREAHPEVQFNFPMEGSRTFNVAGKIDQLAILTDGRKALIEHKTTSESLDSASDYWLRLRFNQQVLQYVDAARKSGWGIETVIYDVVRKPSIRQKKDETPEQFGHRLTEDAAERPDFYFARREVAVLDQDLYEFTAQRRAIAISILAYRSTEKRTERPEHAWPRCVSMMDCRMCEYNGFCLQNLTVNNECHPVGFCITNPHEELA